MHSIINKWRHVKTWILHATAWTICVKFQLAKWCSITLFTSHPNRGMRDQSKRNDGDRSDYWSVVIPRREQEIIGILCGNWLLSRYQPWNTDGIISGDERGNCQSPTLTCPVMSKTRKIWTRAAVALHTPSSLRTWRRSGWKILHIQLK